MALPERVLSKQGFELQFATNHLGHFLLFQLLAERLMRSSTPDFPSKVVNVSSSGHRFGPVNFEDLTLEKNYDPWTAYAQSKLANIWMANYIRRNYGPKGLHALSLMTGGIQSGLQAHTPDLQNMAAVPGWAKFLKSTEQGAATTVWAAIGTLWRDKGGVYLEDCRVAEPWVPESGMLGSGYAETAYQLESEEGLWKISCELVDVPGNAL